MPVHGFVLAGGRSTRMGRDKALLEFRGTPMVEIAVEKLRSLCAEVSIVGDREDLASFAAVVRGEREGLGPAGGIEAGLRNCAEEWALFTPVDVPLVPGELLRRWSEEAIRRGTGEYLVAGGRAQSAFCILPASAVGRWSEGVDAGERKLELLLRRAGAVERNAEDLASRVSSDRAAVQSWFQNVNTPEELSSAEQASR